MRAFIALELPQNIKDRLGAEQDRLKRLFTGRWVKPENLHLTLLFLGEINEAQATAAGQAIAAQVRETKKIITRFNALGCFPNKKNPRVLFAGLDQEAIFEQLYRDLSAHLNIVPEKRFLAHITLCRFKEEKADIPHAWPLLAAGETFTMDMITLFKSTLAFDGPVYEKIFSQQII